ncbi:MAG: DNA translocase FtsK [Planctomycetes bacterium]|nr:DNA translocase FtsK [Planctomycetota bacterium]NOG55708.1 hypothetical protein [Planctomycetota bacterium]
MAQKSPGKSSARTSGKTGKKGAQAAALSATQVRQRIGWVFLLCAVVFVTLSLASFDPADPPTHAYVPANEDVTNWCGPAGAVTAYHLYRLLGAGIWVGIGLIGAYLTATARGHAVSHPLVRALGGFVMVLAVSAMQAIFFPAVGSFPEGGGGLLMIAGTHAVEARFSTVGTVVVVLFFFGAGALVALDDALLIAPRLLLRGLARFVPWARRLYLWTAARRANRREAEAGMRWPSTLRQAIGLDAQPDDEAAESEADDDDEHIRVRMHGKPATEVVDEDEEYEEQEDDDLEEGDEEETESDEQEAGGDGIDMDALRAKVMKLPINFASRNIKEADDADIPRTVVDYSDYRFPGLDLLAEPEATYSEQMEQYVRDQAASLEHALQTYRIDGKVVEIDSGPVITLYEVQLAPGTKVAAISSIQSDIARALRAPNIRIVPNMAGKTTVGIEVPNLNKERVRLKELMTSAPESAKMHLPMFLAKDASGTPLVADLSAMPHMLIAGTTGSGKSVCINTIIISFLYTKRPDELKLILVDPKMVEMTQFKNIPHLMCPVVTETAKAAAILEWAVTRMEERYELLAEVGVRDIASYNELGWEEISERLGPMSEEEAVKIPKKLPYIVFVVDELADLIMTCKEAETAIVRIAQKARAVGIHLILATQRPQANVVTGLIKSNMPCRVSFKVASGMDSRIVLDQKGAELLLGQGDMLFLGPRSSELIRAQGTLVDDIEIRRVVRFLKDVAAPSFERQLLTIRSSGVHDGSGDDEDGDFSSNERDPLFFDAVDVIVQSKRGSVSLLQRRLAIGYTRASRLIDQMGQAGIIGEHKGTVAREVVVTPEEWQEMRRMMEEGETQGSLFQEEKQEPSASLAAASPTDPSVNEDDDDDGGSDVDDAPIELKPQPGELPLLDVDAEDEVDVEDEDDDLIEEDDIEDENEEEDDEDEDDGDEDWDEDVDEDEGEEDEDEDEDEDEEDDSIPLVEYMKQQKKAGARRKRAD